VNRRRFLQVAGAAALAAFLSACGASRDELLASPFPSPTTSPVLPSATPTYVPYRSPTRGLPSEPADTGDTFVSPLGSPEAPTPTEEPSPTPTEAPPTPTPTPPPTPFPAGPPTKLGLFVAWYHPQIMDLIATGNVALLKTLEFDPTFLADIKGRSPNTLVIGRATLNQVDLNRPDMKAEAQRAVDATLALALDPRRAGLIDAWEGFNEPVAGDEDQMRKLADLEMERVRLLADNGLRAVIGNFGAGQPPLEWWPAFRSALEAAQAQGGYLGLHEYSAPTIWYNTNREPLDFRADRADEGWLTLRYRKIHQQFLGPWGLRLPLLITECGVDGMVTNRPGPPGQGWQDFGSYWAELGMGPDIAGNYVEQLAWYDSELQLDDYIHGAAVFAMTAFDQWLSYQIQGEAATILQQYLSVHPMR
jgi:hypothetical protein